MLKEPSNNTINTNINTEEKLLFISVAATGLDPFKDRICKISLLDSYGQEYEFLINPEMPVKDYAFKAHGLKDSALKKGEKLENISEELIEILETHDVIVSYNFSFVFQILQTELYRVSGYRFLEENYTFIDPYLIFKKLYPYNLKNAVKTFLGSDYQIKDNANFSAKVLKDIYEAQVENNSEIFGNSLRELEHNTIGDIGIPGRWFNLKEDHFVFAIGKFKGKKVTEEYQDYLNWLSSLEDITVSERKFIEDMCSSNSL